MGKTIGIPLLSNMEKLLLSVIITEQQEQNTEKLLEQLASQTISEDCYEIIRKTVWDDNVSAARNRGMKRAKGEYIIFLSSDNRLQPEALNYLIAMIQPNLGNDTYPKSDDSGHYPRRPVDMASCGYVIQTEDTLLDYSPERNVKVLDRDDAMLRHFYIENYQGYLWNKIFRKSIIDGAKLHFREDIYRNEDRVFIIEYLKHSKFIRMAPEILVGYEIVEREPVESTLDEMQFFEREVTGIGAFKLMRRAMRGHADAKYMCDQNMAYEELQKYFEILQSDSPENYAKSSLRKYAKKFKKLDFEPATEEDAELLESYLHYAKTGEIVY